jgi:small subunit ribosomal protein S9
MKSVQVSGRRKSAIARASISAGSGIVKINNIPIEIIQPKFTQLRIKEPLLLTEELSQKVDISISVQGGGPSGQADAIRLAIARGLIEFSNDEKIKNVLLNYDRTLLVADVRRREMRKPNTRGRARAKRQKSYR